MKPSIGSLWLVLTGACMEFCIMLYGIIVQHNIKTPLIIQYSGGILNPRFGWSFYLVLFTGVICILLGLGIYIYLMYHPEFDHNLLDERNIEFTEEEKPVSHEEEKIPYHRRKLSIYGHHTVVKRVHNKDVVETKIDDTPKMAAAGFAPIKEVPEPSVPKMMDHAPITQPGDVEMLPMSKMMSKSRAHDVVAVDEEAFEASNLERNMSSKALVLEVNEC